MFILKRTHKKIIEKTHDRHIQLYKRCYDRLLEKDADLMDLKRRTKDALKVSKSYSTTPKAVIENLEHLLGEK